MSADNSEFALRIAGEVVVSENPGDTMRKWRERIAVKQAVLAREMGLSPSVLSDYESGRRASPGVGFIKRYVYALVKARPEPSTTSSEGGRATGQIGYSCDRRVQGTRKGKETTRSCRRKRRYWGRKTGNGHLRLYCSGLHQDDICSVGVRLLQDLRGND